METAPTLAPESVLVRDVESRVSVFELRLSTACLWAPLDLSGPLAHEEWSHDPDWVGLLYVAQGPPERLRRGWSRRLTLASIPLGASLRVLVRTTRGEGWGYPLWRACDVLSSPSRSILGAAE